MIFAEIKYQNLGNYALEEVFVSKLELLTLKDPGKLEQKFVELVALIKDNIQKLDALK